MRLTPVRLPTLVLGLLAGPAWAADDTRLDDPAARASYGLGYRMGQDLKRQAESAARKQAGIEFLKENKAKAGVKTTESGLQYKVLTAGAGKQPGPTDRVRVHYRGRTVEG